MSIKKVLPFVLLTAVSCSSAPSEDVKMSAALADLGRSLLQEGKPADARDVYIAAVGRDSENAPAWNGLGVSNELMGKRGEAREAFDKAHDLNPDDMMAANNLAYLNLQEGNAEAALALLEPYVEGDSMPVTLKENYEKALKLHATSPVIPSPRKADRAASAEATKAAAHAAAKAVEAKAVEKTGENYADLGDYPTDAIARARMDQLWADEDFPKDLKLLVYSGVNKVGGTPLFSLRAMGKDSRAICEDLEPLHISCVPRENGFEDQGSGL
ncbi:MAG: tetratricopeptide repeat protein [Alphaproteobacteria bacterium]|nr:tetratricopeptide repeat protein [Alphaproteobacteria bacterium]